MHAAAGTRLHAHDTTFAARSMQMTCLRMPDEVPHVFPLRRPGFDDACAMAADEEGAVGIPRCRQHEVASHISNEKNQRQREHESSCTSTVAKLNGRARDQLTPPLYR